MSNSALRHSSLLACLLGWALAVLSAALFTAAVLTADVLTADDAAALPAAAQAAGDYTRLLEFRYGSDPIVVPEGGLTFSRDTATWTLESGSLRLAEPTAAGLVTGLVFEGRGRFRMVIPDPVELRQLQRMAGDRRLEILDTTFDSAVLRTSETLIAELLPQATHAGYATSSLAKDRHQHWLTQRFEDVDARVVCGSLMIGDEFLHIAMETDRFGRLTYTFDGLEPEEIAVSHWNAKDAGVEWWLQLDRPEHRLESGRPQTERRRLIDLEHVAVIADVTEANKKFSRLGRAAFNPRQGKYQVEITFTALEDGHAALPLDLSALAELQSVESEDGTALGFLRDHIGGRSSALDKMLYDNNVVVLLDRPLVRGEKRRLRFTYEQMTLNYLPGGSWYPTPADFFADLHTGEFTITSEDRFDIFAMGERTEVSAAKGTKRTVWKLDKPTRMLTFAFADQHTQVQEMEKEGMPKVIAFGPSNENQIWNVAADTVNSINYFQQLFEQPIGAPTMYVTGILGGHGQSFEGFIHMSETSMHFESKGRTEAFRAHEVAHQWWGHEVAWKSYRDQWLSEAFAEYAAMLFMQATMDDGQKMYDDMVTAYTGSVTGKLEPSRFDAWIERNDKERERIGPISVGYRASTAGAGGGYFGTTYQKGALVLHMLRTVLRNVAKSDQVFFDVLRRFLDDHAGGAASTDDFIATLTAVAPGNWQWFFDQWVHDTDVPTYTWSWDTASEGGKTLLRLTVAQSGVAPGFRMPVPVAIDFGKDKGGQVVVLVDKPEETFTIPLPAKPKSVEFNPDHAVLAVTKKR